MGEMISDLFLGNKNLRKLIDKTLLKVALLLLFFFSRQVDLRRRRESKKPRLRLKNEKLRRQRGAS